MEIWKFLAGLGLFLYGMNLTEHVLKKVSGRSFKIFLKKYTQNLFKAIAGGALVTGLLQSSSVVALLVLAFVGAGIITFRNALGVILGSNLGTTLSSWIVATVGFKLNIESYSLPVIAVTAITMFFVHRQKKIYNLLRLLFAIAILFFGIGLMKSGAESLVDEFDFTSFSHYSTFVFVLVGFALTTIIQSSSATVAITLTALHTNAITFPAALAIVIGSELGTTIKIVLAASNGSPDKKRVAWGNFTFNIATTIVAYACLPWLILFIQDVLKIMDPLVGAVFFQSAINLLSIVIFVPIINPFARWLEQKFKNDEHFETSFITRGVPVVAALATDSVFHETERLLQKIAEFHRHLLAIDNSKNIRFFQSLTQQSGISEKLYEKLKKTEGEILLYCSTFQPDDLDLEQHGLINKYLSAIRHGIHSAKALKDIQHNLKELANTSEDVLNEQYLQVQDDWREFDLTFKQMVIVQNQKTLFEELALAMKVAFHKYHQNNAEIINALKKKGVTEVQASTMMNVQVEILSAKKSLLRALAHLNLTASQANTFEFLPEN